MVGRDGVLRGGAASKPVGWTTSTAESAGDQEPALRLLGPVLWHGGGYVCSTLWGENSRGPLTYVGRASSIGRGMLCIYYMVG
jgi:hypothetical protein